MRDGPPCERAFRWRREALWECLAADGSGDARSALNSPRSSSSSSGDRLRGAAVLRQRRGRAMSAIELTKFTKISGPLTKQIRCPRVARSRATARPA